VVYDANNFQECEVTAYNPATGSLSFAAPTRTAGSGTYSAWSVNLDGASGGDGSSGTSGTSATAGTSGSTGTSGSSGSSGSSGTSGSSGSAGTAGTSGRNGIDGSSGASIANWYGAFTSTATQVVTAANTPTAITYTNDELSNGIVYSGSQLTVQHTGIYEIAYSLQIEHTGGGGADVNIWLRKNGANIIRTDSILGLRSQSAKQLPFVSIIDSANANDYYEVYFQANASDVQVTAVAATGTIPAAPSIITNIKQIGIAVGTTSGTSGSSGSSGSSGINGSSGNTGSSGSAGSSGSSGTSGVDGSTGSSGSAGSSGSSGSSGTTGTSGSSATSGTSGTSGSAGSSGSSGTTGTSGTSATSGSTGTSGSSGTSGNATTSARAVQTFTSTSGQTTFTVTNGYNLGMVDVFVNGVKFVNGTDFTATNGTTVVMAAALTAGNIVEIDNLLTAYLPTNALRTITTFTATAAQTTFSVSYTQGLIDVFYNGSCLAQSEYTATNGTSIILATACQLNDIVVVYAYSYSVGAYSGIGGSGTSGYHAKFTGTNTIGNGLIYDNGTSLYIGNGQSSATPQVGIIEGTDGSGTNIAGAEFRIQGGQGTGTGTGGALTFYTSPAGTTGSSLNSAVERMRITTAGNVGIGTSSPASKISMGGAVSQAAPLTYTPSEARQGFFNTYYSNSESLFPQYLDIVSYGQPDGTNGGGIIRFLTNPVTSSSAAVERFRINADGSAKFLFASDRGLRMKGAASSYAELAAYQVFTENIRELRLTGSTIQFYSGDGSNSTGAERMRISEAGNVLIGSTTDAGHKLYVNGFIKNNASLTNNGSVSANNGTAVTLFSTATYFGMYLVFAYLPAGTGDPNNYSAYAIIINDGTTSKIMQQTNGGRLTITTSGNNVQGTQTSGGGPYNIVYVYQLISS
jgi:hypothetical protein